MPSTAWNVFVASGVAIVVYFAVRMGQVLLGLAAGTILFLGGWLTGYAINEDLLDSMGLLRVGVAGAVSAFVVFWTLVVVEGEYLTGVLVIGLVWFATWFTSDMGPIKGETGAMATIDEPRPPAGRPPGDPIDLGGEQPPEPAPRSNRTGVLGTLRGLVTPANPDPPEQGAPGPDGPSSDDLTDHAAPNADPDEPTYSTRRTDPADASSEGRESMFGLGIFYEGDPDGQGPAGADAGDPESSTPVDGDHTRPSAADGRSTDDEGAADSERGTDDERTTDATRADEGTTDPEPAADGQSDDEVWTAANADERGGGGRHREPVNSPRPPGQSPETEPESGEEPSRGSEATAAEAAGSAATTDENEGSAEPSTDEEDDPPEEHRVDVDESGFTFG